MASTKWLSNAVKASIVTAAIGAVGTISAAAIGKSCPAPPASDKCASVLAYAASFQSKPLPEKLQASVDQCTGARP